MSDQERTPPAEPDRGGVQDGPPDGAAGEGEPASSPFDHPYFLPALLFVFAAWFGYDGWYNEEIEAVMFNRYGFVVLLMAGVYTSLDTFVRNPFLLPGFLAAGGGILVYFGWFTDPNEQRLFDQIAGVAVLSSALYLAVQVYVQSLFLLPALVFAGAGVLAWFGWSGEESETDVFLRGGCYVLLALGVALTVRAFRGRRVREEG